MAALRQDSVVWSRDAMRFAISRQVLSFATKFSEICDFVSSAGTKIHDLLSRVGRRHFCSRLIGRLGLQRCQGGPGAFRRRSELAV
jgi:hypothetical protein